MKLLVTGGTGLIGSRLALAARARGFDVVVTGQVNNETEQRRKATLESAGVTLVVGPLQDAGFARRVVAGCDAVIHLAAAQHEANVPDSYFRAVNVDGTRSLLEASAAAGVRRFVYGSTIGVYGSALSGELDEDSPTRPDNIYGRTKLEAEGIVREFATRMQTVIVRISETYGPGDFRLLKLFKGLERGRFFIIGAGDNRRQVIHVDDLARGLLAAAEHPAAVGQTFVMAGLETMTTRSMVTQVSQALGRPEPKLSAPMWPFMLTAIVMEKTLKPLGIQPPLHRRRLDFFRKSFVFSTDRARTVLGFSPTISFAEGAGATARWYREQGLLGGQR